MTTVQQWRHEHGLPVQLVIVGDVVQPWSSSILAQGIATVTYRQPCRITWLKVFWNELLLLNPQQPQQQQHSPTPFPLVSSEALSQVLQNYQCEHGSLTRLCHDLQSNITEFYSHDPSTLVWDAVERHPLFLAWFGVHGTAKKWLSLSSGAVKYVALEECQRIQHDLLWWWIWPQKLLPFLMTRRRLVGNSSETNEVMNHRDDKTLLLSSLAELYHDTTVSFIQNRNENDTENEIKATCLPTQLERYWDRVGQRKRKTEKNPTTTTSSTSHSKQQEPQLQNEKQQALTLLYELILIVGATSEDDTIDGDAAAEAKRVTPLTPMEEMEGIERMLHELFDLCVKAMGQLYHQWNSTNPLASQKSSSMESQQGPLMSSASSCHHRQTLVEGLGSPARELYGLLQDRLSIPRDEWLYLFGGSPHDFMQGVWTLVLLGLVQSKSRRSGGGTGGGSTDGSTTGSSRRKGTNVVYYEKVSVMWC